MNANQCQTNDVSKFVRSAEKGPFTGWENTPSFNRIGNGPNASPILNNEIEREFLQHSEGFNQTQSYTIIHPRTLEEQNHEFTAPNPSGNETSWAKDFRYSFPENIEPPVAYQFTNLNLNGELQKSRIESPSGFYSHKNFNIASFPVVDHQIFKTRGLKYPIDSHIDSFINAEFLELETSSLQEEIYTEEENSGTGQENEEVVIKSLASDIVEFCGNNSADKDVKERLNNSKFIGLMGNISDGSIVLKKDKGGARNLQKHVGFCFQKTGSWAGLEFHDVEDRIA